MFRRTSACPCISAFSIGFVLAIGLLAGYSILGAMPALAVGIQVTDPITNQVGVDLDADIIAIYDVAIDPATVTTDTFAAHAMMSGLISGTFTFGGDNTIVTLNPDDDYFAGEVVRVSATGGISDTSVSPVDAYQWQFTAGPVMSRCLAGFTEIETGLPGVKSSEVAWGDYDNDGYLDFLLEGDDGEGGFSTRVYHNDRDGTFGDSGVSIPRNGRASAAWGDYNNDGYLDILVAAWHIEEPYEMTQVWRNDRDGTFSDLGDVAWGAYWGVANWSDYDNDGDQDILTVGLTGWGNTTACMMWLNDGGSFGSVDLLVTDRAYYASAAWGDYDNDGNIDLLVTGFDTSTEPPPTSTVRISEVYRNAEDHTFSPIGAGLTGVANGSTAWGDYDNDGYLDILLTGDTGSGYIARVYHNDRDGTFSDSGADLPGVAYGAVAWGDYDNDGYLDILLTGDSGSGYIARVYHNDRDGTFGDADAGLIGVRDSAAAWGDYDNDGDLDILLAGDGGEDGLVTRLYRNDDCAELHIAKQVEPSADMPYHDVVTYTAVLSNAGGIAYDVTMSDTLPGEVDFGGWVGDSHNANESDDEITWTGTVSGSTTITWTWQVTHTGGYGETVTNTVRAAHPGSEQTVEADAAFSVKTAPSLVITKTAAPVTDVDYHGVVTYSATLSNLGESGADDTLLTDTLPGEVEFAGWVGDKHGASESDDEITWTGTVSAVTAMTWTWQVTHTGGYGDVVENTADYRHTSGSGSATATFWITSTRIFYLPLIYKGFVSAPDLVVDIVEAGSDTVSVVVTNQGNKTVTEDFWIDVYFNPRVRPPQINQIWPTIAAHGVVWGVRLDLPPNVPLILTNDLADPNYYPQYSSSLPLPVGQDVYAYVDSVDRSTTWGAVLESDETNNTDGPVVSAGGEALTPGDPPTLERGEIGNLPPR